MLNKADFYFQNDPVEWWSLGMWKNIFVTNKNVLNSVLINYNQLRQC